MADPDIETETRTQFKYGCLHGVDGTPQVYVAGVLAENLDGEATFQDWQDVLEPLVGRATARIKLEGRAKPSVV